MRWKCRLRHFETLIPTASGLRICILLAVTVGVSSFAENNLNATPNAGVAAKPTRHRQSFANTERQSAAQSRVHRRLEPASAERFASTDHAPSIDPQEYVIGPEDVLDINVFEAPEMIATCAFQRAAKSLCRCWARLQQPALRHGSWKRPLKSCFIKNT